MKCPTCKQSLPAVTEWNVNLRDLRESSRSVLAWFSVDDDEGAQVGQEGNLATARATLAETLARFQADRSDDNRDAVDYAAVEVAAFEWLARDPGEGELYEGAIRWMVSLKTVKATLKVQANALVVEALAATRPALDPRTAFLSFLDEFDTPEAGTIRARFKALYP